MSAIIQGLNRFLGRTERLLSITIEGTSLKLLASRGKQVSAWSITQVNPRFLRIGFAADPPGLASVIKAKVSEKEFAGRYRVLASIPAFHSISRTLSLPDLPEVRPEVAVPQQARRDYGYSPENNILRWQPLATGGDRRFFILSAPREPVITLIETLRLAGLRASKIETSTFALSRAVNQPDAIILAVETNSLESIILRGGIPLATRSTFLGERPQDPEMLPTLVTDTLDNIISFYLESYPDDPLPTNTPVYLFGSAPSLSANITTAVEAALGHPVAQFEPPILYPEKFPKAEFAVNIGLMLGEL